MPLASFSIAHMAPVRKSPVDWLEPEPERKVSQWLVLLTGWLEPLVLKWITPSGWQLVTLVTFPPVSGSWCWKYSESRFCRKAKVCFSIQHSVQWEKKRMVAPMVTLAGSPSGWYPCLEAGATEKLERELHTPGAGICNACARRALGWCWNQHRIGLPQWLVTASPSVCVGSWCWIPHWWSGSRENWGKRLHKGCKGC